MSAPLAGYAVVVTRPAAQADRLIALLREQGAVTVAFPTLVIEPVAPEPAVQASCATPGAFDWVVYTSANAVEHGIAALGRPGQARVAAIGRATARALEARGLPVDALPASGADTEALLAHPEFASLVGRRVLLVKGAGGRDALRAGLVGRGATVALAEVYRRQPAVPTAHALQELQQLPRSATTLVTAATSVEVLESLLALAPAAVLPALLDAALLVPGERVAGAARRLGWRGPVMVAPSAEDAVMLATLLDASARARRRGGA